MGLEEGKVPCSLLLLIMSSDIIREYHFSQVGIFHSEMGEELESKVVDQPYTRRHIYNQAA